MIEPFVLYADSTIIYNGRAQSVLPRGNYLIIAKADGSVLIHGADLVNPRNYMSAGTIVQVSERSIVCQRRQESIIIDIYETHSHYHPPNWSTDRISIIRTEKELQEKLVTNLEHYIPGVVFEIVMPEAVTNLGNCDVLGLDSNDIYHIIEIKRAKITTSAVVQLRKYLEALASTGKSALGYVAAPTIIGSAMQYAVKHNIKYIAVDYA